MNSKLSGLVKKILINGVGKERLKRIALNKKERILIRLQDDEYLRKNNFEKSYLQESGWLESAISGKIVDENGLPLPWLTLPFIHFLEPRLQKRFHIFEYGSGYSTLFYASRVKTIYAVEHDREWYEKVKQDLPENATIFHEKLEENGDYSKKSNRIGELFDLIIIDGMDRVNCCFNAPKSLSENGVIILDNSNRPEYKKGIEYLLGLGFKNIDFTGMAPRSPQLSCTSIYYRINNCLSI